MLYLIAIILPFVATLLERKILTSIVLLVLQLTLIGWPVAILAAWVIIADARATRRANKIARSVGRGRRAQF